MVIALVSSGCYVHRSIGEIPEPNTEVTVTLTDDQAGDVSRILGPGARQVDGRVLSSPPDTIGLAVHRVRRANGRLEQWKGERVALPRRDVARVAQRRFSPGATAGIVAGAVTGLVLAVYLAGRDPVTH
jgi:hypothetical protein